MSNSKTDMGIDSEELHTGEIDTNSPGDLQRKRESEIELALNLHLEENAAGKGTEENSGLDTFEVPKLSPEEFAQLLKQKSMTSESTPNSGNLPKSSGPRLNSLTRYNSEAPTSQYSDHSEAQGMDYVNLINVRTNRQIDSSLRNLRWQINSDELLKELVQGEFVLSDENVIQLILLHYFEPGSSTSSLQGFLASRIGNVSDSLKQATERLQEILMNFTNY